MRKNFNTTIDEETIATIDRLAVGGKSKGAVVDEAVALLIAPKVDTHSEVDRWFQQTWERLDEILETVQTVEPKYLESGDTSTAANIARAQEIRFDPASIPGISVGLPPKPPVIIKRYKCDHCGASPAVPRVGDICENCRDSGHADGVRDCPICGDRGTGAL